MTLPSRGHSASTKRSSSSTELPGHQTCSTGVKACSTPTGGPRHSRDRHRGSRDSRDFAGREGHQVHTITEVRVLEGKEPRRERIHRVTTAFVGTLLESLESASRLTPMPSRLPGSLSSFVALAFGHLSAFRQLVGLTCRQSVPPMCVSPAARPRRHENWVDRSLRSGHQLWLEPLARLGQTSDVLGEMCEQPVQQLHDVWSSSHAAQFNVIKYTADSGNRTGSHQRSCNYS